MNNYQNAGIKVVDISNPSKPLVINSVKTEGWLNSVVISDGYAFVAYSNFGANDYKGGLYVIDISYMLKQVIRMDATPDYATGVAISDGYAFTVWGDDNGYGGLQVTDITDPSKPNFVVSVYTPGYARSITISGDKAFVALQGVKGGVAVMDISNPLKPNIIASVNTPGRANSVTVSDGYAFVARGNGYGYQGGIDVIDITDPSKPNIIASFNTPSYANSVTVSGDKVFIACNNGFEIVDISDPLKPNIIGSVVIPYANSVTVSDSYVFVARGNESYDQGGIDVIDITDPSKPNIIASADTPGRADSVTVSDGYVFVAFDDFSSSYKGGLAVINIADPSKPNIIASVDTPGSADSVTVSDGCAFVADSSAGLVILPLPVEITPVVKSETDMTVILPSPKIPGHYMLRVFNGNESCELNGAVSFLNLPVSKAIIVAGGGPSKWNYSNSLWEDTRTVADSAYRALLYQGYLKENIYYLSDEPRDVDGIGGFDDIDGDATVANLSYAVNTWAMGGSPANDLILYITDHGGDGVFRMNTTEDLKATELDAWLDDLQKILSGKIIVIYDACQSGTFVPLLTQPEGKTRIVISSASDESALFIPVGGFPGGLSFSYHFWSRIHEGSELKEAFTFARDIMKEFQKSLLDGDGDGVANTAPDFRASDNIIIGRGYKRASDIPFITAVSPEQTLTDTATATVIAENITDTDGISEVKAVILPPGFSASPETPVQSLPEIQLADTDGDGKYEGVCKGFVIKGTYSISIYATDTQGIISLPKQTTVIQTENLCTKGDINSDGEVNLADAVAVLQILIKQDINSFVNLICGDVNGDNRAGLEDAVYIFQNISKLRE